MDNRSKYMLVLKWNPHLRVLLYVSIRRHKETNFQGLVGNTLKTNITWCVCIIKTENTAQVWAGNSGCQLSKYELFQLAFEEKGQTGFEEWKPASCSTFSTRWAWNCSVVCLYVSQRFQLIRPPKPSLYFQRISVCQSYSAKKKEHNVLLQFKDEI